MQCAPQVQWEYTLLMAHKSQSWKASRGTMTYHVSCGGANRWHVHLWPVTQMHSLEDPATEKKQLERMAHFGNTTAADSKVL